MTDAGSETVPEPLRDPAVESLLRHARFARGLAGALLRDAHLADDAVQETWLAALRRPPRAAAGAWVRAVTRNVALKLRRSEVRRGRRERAASVPEASREHGPEREAMLREVVEAVAALPEPYRTTVFQRFYEDLPPREIAARERVAVSTVNSRLQRAVAMLRERLDGRHRGGRAGWTAALVLLVGDDVARPGTGAGAASASVAATAMGVVMAKKTLAVIGLVLLLAAAAGTAAWFAQSTQDASPRGAAPGDGAHNGARDVSGVSPRARTRAGAAPTDETPAAPAVATKPPATPELAGTVEGPRGPVSGVRVYAVAEDAPDGDRRIVAETRTDAAGAFWLDLPDARVRDGAEIDVGALAQGLRRDQRTVSVRRGETVRTDLRLRSGGSLEGQVVRSDGTPVAGLALLALALPSSPAVVTREHLDTDRALASQRDATAQFARTTSDAVGRFVVDGLGDAPYVVLSEEPAWILEAAPATAGAQGLRVVAWPARTLTLRVKDAASGRPVEPCWASIRFTRTTPGFEEAVESGVPVRDGGAWVQWDPRRAGPAESGDAAGAKVRTALVLRADGYHDRELALAPDAAGAVVADAEMDPAVDETLAKLRLEVFDATGAPAAFDVSAALISPRRGGAGPTVERLTREAAGRFTLTASPGEWRLVVSPSDGLGALESVRDVELTAGRQEWLRIDLPAHGWLVVRRPDSRTEKWIEVSDGRHSRGAPSTARELRFRVAPGTWTVRVGQDQSGPSRTATVSALAETVVDLDE